MKLILILLLLLLLIPAASATDYYVKIDGNNSLDGLSVENAWKNPSYAVLQSTAGDTVYLIDGTWYNETLRFSDDAGNNVYTSGNSTHPITITAYNGTPILDGSDVTGRPFFFKDNANAGDYINGYVNVSGISFYNYTGTLHAQYLKGIYISNSTFSNFGSTAVGFVDTMDSSLIDSYIYDMGWNSVQISATWGNTSNILIKNNTIHSNSAHNLIDLFMNAPNSNMGISNITIIDNILYDCTWSGIFPHRSADAPLSFNNINVSNNHISNINQGGIQFGMFKDSIISGNVLDGADVGIQSQAGNFTGLMATVSNNSVSNVDYWTDCFNILTESGLARVHFIDNIGAFYKIYVANVTVTNPLTTHTYYRSYSNANIHKINFTDNTVFEASNNVIAGITPTYYPTESSFYGVPINGVTHTIIKRYNMKVIPDTNSSTVTVTKFNTSEPVGSTSVEFSINSTNGTNNNIVVYSLKINHDYEINRSNVNYLNLTADSNGYIEFNNSEWSTKSFTVSDLGYNESQFIPDAVPYLGRIFRTYQSGNITQCDTVLSTDTKLDYFEMVII